MFVQLSPNLGQIFELDVWAILNQRTFGILNNLYFFFLAILILCLMFRFQQVEGGDRGKGLTQYPKGYRFKSHI